MIVDQKQFMGYPGGFSAGHILVECDRCHKRFEMPYAAGPSGDLIDPWHFCPHCGDQLSWKQKEENKR